MTRTASDAADEALAEVLGDALQEGHLIDEMPIHIVKEMAVALILAEATLEILPRVMGRGELRDTAAEELDQI